MSPLIPLGPDTPLRDHSRLVPDGLIGGPTPGIAVPADVDESAAVLADAGTDAASGSTVSAGGAVGASTSKGAAAASAADRYAIRTEAQ